MNIRYISIIILLLSVLSASADKKMTIRNSDTGESFEVSDPDGMRIYEYNSNWLDSIPYVLERARYGEPWAYEALGDCYRYGKGGVERSIFKAYFYYHLADMDIEQIAIESMAKNPTDQLGNTFILMEMLEHGNKQDVISFLETLNFKDNADLKVLRDFVIEPDTIILKHVVEQNIISGDSSTDKMMFTMFGCYYLNWFPDSFKEKSEIVAAAGNKLPYLYNEIAVKFFSDSHEDLDSATIVKKTAKAFSFLEYADIDAMLSRDGAEILYRHYKSEIEAGRMAFDKDNMERLAIWQDFRSR